MRFAIKKATTIAPIDWAHIATLGAIAILIGYMNKGGSLVVDGISVAPFILQLLKSFVAPAPPLPPVEIPAAQRDTKP